MLSFISIFCASDESVASGIYSLHRQEGNRSSSLEFTCPVGLGRGRDAQPQLGCVGSAHCGWRDTCRKLPQFETGSALPQGGLAHVLWVLNRAEPLTTKINLNQYPSMKTIFSTAQACLYTRSIKPKELSNQKSFPVTKHYIQCFVKYFCGFFFFQIFYGQCHLIQKSFQEIHLLFASLIVPWCQTWKLLWNRQGHEDMCFLMDLETISV